MCNGYHSLWYFKYNVVKFALGYYFFMPIVNTGIGAQLELSAPVETEPALRFLSFFACRLFFLKELEF